MLFTNLDTVILSSLLISNQIKNINVKEDRIIHKINPITSLKIVNVNAPRAAAARTIDIEGKNTTLQYSFKLNPQYFLHNIKTVEFCPIVIKEIITI